MPAKVIVETPQLWKHPEPQFQRALISLAQDVAPDLLSEIKAEAPEDTGNLRENLSLGPIIPFGPTRIQVSVIVNLINVPYYYAVIRGHEEKAVGQEGKTYASKQRDIFFRGQFILPAREANNFPRRAVRRYLPELTGFVARTFITRVVQ
jgi:hypothetical protein